MPETKIIFSKKKKKNSKYEILNQLYFGPNFDFQGTALGHFSRIFKACYDPGRKLAWLSAM